MINIDYHYNIHVYYHKQLNRFSIDYNISELDHIHINVDEYDGHNNHKDNTYKIYQLA